MKLSNISFGKIVKVYAPFEIAKQIEDIANFKPTNKKILKNDIYQLFNDVNKGKARTFYFDKTMSFIFSGPESNTFYEISQNQKTSDAEKREQIMHFIADNDGASHSVDPIVKKSKLISLNLII